HRGSPPSTTTTDRSSASTPRPRPRGPRWSPTRIHPTSPQRASSPVPTDELSHYEDEAPFHPIRRTLQITRRTVAKQDRPFDRLRALRQAQGPKSNTRRDHGTDRTLHYRRMA